MKGQRKRTLTPCILVLQPSPNRPHYDIQGKGTPIKAYPNPARSYYFKVLATLNSDPIRIIDTDELDRRLAIQLRVAA